MGVIERMAKQYGFNEVKYLEDDHYTLGVEVEFTYFIPETSSWKRRVVNNLLVGKRFDEFVDNLIKKYPQLEIGIQSTIWHERGHVPLSKDHPDYFELLERMEKSDSWFAEFGVDYREIYADVYEVSKCENPIEGIAASLYIFYKFGWIQNPNARNYLDRFYPFLTSTAKDKIFKLYNKMNSKLILDRHQILCNF